MAGPCLAVLSPLDTTKTSFKILGWICRDNECLQIYLTAPLSRNKAISRYSEAGKKKKKLKEAFTVCIYS